MHTDYVQLCQTGNAQRLKRLAAQILSQLPEDREEAIAALALVRALIEWENGVETTILPFVRLVTPEI